MNQTDDRFDTRALGDAITGLLAAPAQITATLLGSLTRVGSPGCDIPPPCWEPRPAGTCALTLSPGSTGTIRVHVTNCNWDRGVVGVTAVGRIAGWLAFHPTTQVIDPQSRATFMVTVRVPENVKPGESLSGPLLVRGCLDHFVRLDVAVAECAGRTCCDVSIQDCQDQVHHWYDHFYCPRPCRQHHTQDARHG